MARQRELKTGLGVGIILLNKKREVLLGWHKDRRRVGWGLPGGEVELGEDIFDAARRELWEETGIKCQNIEMVSVSSHKLKTGDWVTLGFMCRSYTGNPQLIEPHKIDKWEWYPIDNLPNPIFPPSEKIIENYKAGRLYNVKEAEKAQGQS